jgi:hypothetical protein
MERGDVKQRAKLVRPAELEVGLPKVSFAAAPWGGLLGKVDGGRGSGEGKRSPAPTGGTGAED